VAHAALLGLYVALRRLGLLFIVVGLELRIVDIHLGGKLGQAQLDVAQIDRLRGHVLRLVRVVVRLDGGIVGRRIGGVLRRRERDPGELALLSRQLEKAFDFGRRREGRGADRLVELAQLHVAAKCIFDLRHRASLRFQHRQRIRVVEFAVQLELRVLRHFIEDLPVAHPVAELIRARGEGLAVDVIVQHALLDRGALKIVERPIRLALVLGELALIGLAHVVAGDLDAVHLRGVVGRAQGPIDAPEHEHQGDRAEHQPRHPSLQLVVNRLQHDPRTRPVTLHIPSSAALRRARDSSSGKWRSGRDSNPRPPA
jgi:hypothetical protein